MVLLGDEFVGLARTRMLDLWEGEPGRFQCAIPNQPFLHEEDSY